MNGGNHRDRHLEHGLVSVDPLQTGQCCVSGDLGVGRRRVVSRDAEMEVAELYFAVLQHGDPLRRGREREWEGKREGVKGREREGEGGSEGG